MKTTIKIKGVEVEISYTYNPEEKASWGHNGGHPHIPHSIDVNEATINGADVMELIEPFDEEIEEIILKENH